MKNFKIIFCWSAPTPITLRYNNEVLVRSDHEFIVKANSMREVMKNLRESDSKVISNIKNIVEC